MNVQITQVFYLFEHEIENSVVFVAFSFHQFTMLLITYVHTTPKSLHVDLIHRFMFKEMANLNPKRISIILHFGVPKLIVENPWILLSEGL